MRTLEEIDKDIQDQIAIVAKLADERQQIKPNPFRVQFGINASVVIPPEI